MRWIGWPKKVIVPRSARTTPETVRRVVLLPAPLGPSSATTAPAGTVSDTSRRASTPPYATRRPLISSAASQDTGVPQIGGADEVVAADLLG